MPGRPDRQSKTEVRAVILSFVAADPGDAFWLSYPKNEDGQKGRIAPPESVGEVLPNVIPLPRKNSPKQDETGPIRMDYVIEIEGTP